MRSIKLITAVAAAAAWVSIPSLADASYGWRWPVQGRVVTPYRNGADPYAGGQHRGIDIAAPVGTPVVAAVGGTVAFAGVAGSSGLTVAVRTASDGLETTYLHLSSLAVRAGQRVGGGDRIGAVGVSGRRSVEQPHLHFGVRDAGQRHAYRDPLDFLPAPPASEPERPAPHAAPVPVPASAPRVPALVPLRSGPATAPAMRAPRLAPLPSLGRLPAPYAAARPRWTSGATGPATAATPERPGAHVEGRAPGVVPAPHATHQRPSVLLEAGPHADSGPSTRAAPDVERHAGGAAPVHGIDVGWLVACIGLVAVATLLGRPAAPRGTIERTQHRIAALLRPLLGRG
ncbi:MAG: hypothetical protein QOK25_1018 [Thermoleophilaceae bacterium]|jgi:hypothetical protein|nr:hypothetical protein [Thermoleophilaceae bacterium]